MEMSVSNLDKSGMACGRRASLRMRTVVPASNPSDEAASEAAAAPSTIHSVSIFKTSIRTTVNAAMTMVNQSVSASHASGITAASNKPALVITTVSSTVLTRGLSSLRPTKCTSGIISNAGAVMAAHPAIAPRMPPTK